MSIIDTLITDRTRGDYYNITDLNRVGQAMRYVAARLRACGFDVVVTPRTDWVWTDRATPAAAKRYLNNLRKIRKALVLFVNTPNVPSGKRPFTAAEANDIEKILIDAEDMVQRTMQCWYFCGDLYAGEV